MGTLFVVRASAIVSVFIVLAGCTAGATASPAPTAAPTATANPTATATARPTATPSPSPSTAPSQAALDGKATFAFVAIDESKWKTHCGPGRGVIQIADSRVAGEYLNLTCLEEDDEVAANDLWDFWGRWVIWNDGGTWDGQFIGTRDASGNHVVDVTSAGSGDYAGLRLVSHELAGPDDRVWDISNTIGPAPSPDPISTPPESPGRGDPQIAGTRSCGSHGRAERDASR